MLHAPCFKKRAHTALMVTNPPFNRAEQFIRHALHLTAPYNGITEDGQQDGASRSLARLLCGTADLIRHFRSLGKGVRHSASGDGAPISQLRSSWTSLCSHSLGRSHRGVRLAWQQKSIPLACVGPGATSSCSGRTLTRGRAPEASLFEAERRWMEEFRGAS